MIYMFLIHNKKESQLQETTSFRNPQTDFETVGDKNDITK